MDPDDFGRLPEQTPGYGPPAARTRAQLSSARRADSLDTDRRESMCGGKSRAVDELWLMSVWRACHKACTRVDRVASIQRSTQQSKSTTQAQLSSKKYMKALLKFNSSGSSCLPLIHGWYSLSTQRRFYGLNHIDR